MKTPILSIFTWILLFSIQSAFAKNQNMSEEMELMNVYLKTQNFNELKDPCFVTVTVPRSGSTIDCWGNFRIINAIGTCTAHGSSCELAFQEAYQCARSKASEDYNQKLSSYKTTNCAVKTISM